MVCESSRPYDGLEVPSVLSDSIYCSSPQFIPVSPFLPVLGNASSSLPPGIYPCSLLCLEPLSPMSLPAPSFFPVLSREAIPDHAGCNSSFSHSELPITFCLIFLQSTYSLSVICHKLPVYHTYHLSFLPTYRLLRHQEILCHLFIVPFPLPRTMPQRYKIFWCPHLNWWLHFFFPSRESQTRALSSTEHF